MGTGPTYNLNELIFDFFKFAIHYVNYWEMRIFQSNFTYFNFLSKWLQLTYFLLYVYRCKSCAVLWFMFQHFKFFFSNFKNNFLPTFEWSWKCFPDYSNIIRSLVFRTIVRLYFAYAEWCLTSAVQVVRLWG